VKGYLDDVELNKIKKFENDIIEIIKTEKNEIIDSIQNSGKIEEDIEKLLSQTIEDYKKGNK
jgi:F-type H+-transporting ATPase subunit alpha